MGPVGDPRPGARAALGGGAAGRAPARPSLYRRIRRWLRPPRILRPTRAGWIFLVIVMGVGFAALNTGNNLLYLVLSLMLAFLVLSGVLSESALRGIEVRRRVPRELFAGRDNSVQIEVRNNQRRITAFAIVVEDRLEAAADGRLQLTTVADEGKRESRRSARRRRKQRSEAAGRCFLLRIAPRARETRRYTLAPAHRGPLRFSGFRVSTRFPFGLFLKYREYEAFEDALVYPELTAHAARARLHDALSRGESTVARIGVGSVVGGLREFTQGDPVRRVQWRQSIRRSSLVVAETEDDRETEIEVRLRARNTPGRGSDKASGFERAVSRAASEVVAHLQDGLAVALRTDAVYLPPDSGLRQRGRLLSFLALVAPDGRGPREIAP